MRAHKSPQLYQRVAGGAWWCYWRDERWSTKTSDRVEAERVVRDFYDPRVATSREKVVDDVILLVYDALDRRGRTDATKDQARQKLGHFARLWSGRALASVDHVAMEDYVKTRLEEGVVRLTVSHELGYFRQGWKLARARGWVSKSWDELMPERFDRGYRAGTRWLTPDEVRLVLLNLSPEHAAIVAWIVATGCDLGDVWRATAADVDWRRGVVRVRGTKNYFRDRWVAISDVTRGLLKRAKPPFQQWPGIQQSLRKLAKRVGIAHFSPRDLRRTHGQWLRNAGVDPQLIGRQLGHADSEMADRIYAQGDEEALAKLVRMAVDGRTNGVRKRQKNGRERASSRRRSA